MTTSKRQKDLNLGRQKRYVERMKEREYCQLRRWVKVKDRDKIREFLDSLDRIRAPNQR